MDTNTDHFTPLALRVRGNYEGEVLTPADVNKPETGLEWKAFNWLSKLNK